MTRLFKLEFKRTVKNPIFLIVVILFIGFLISNIGRDINKDKLRKPEENQEVYGLKYVEDMDIIKDNSLRSLISEFSSNDYTSYPYGFYKKVHLSPSKEEQVAKLISALTAESIEDLDRLKSDRDLGETMSIDSSLSDQEFIELMYSIDRLIGRGSSYGKTFLLGLFGQRQMTYQEAVEEYELALKEDKISGAFARHFADYAGIPLAFLPVFVSVALWYMDKSSGSQDLLYSREIKTGRLVWTRYLAQLASLSLVILLMASYYNLRVIQAYGLDNIDPLAYYKYSIVWLLPSLMVSLAFGTLATILTDSPLGIIGQFIWMFLDLSSNYEDMTGGGYGHKLIMRHNTVGNTSLYLDNISSIIKNRIGYSLLAILMVFISIYFLDKRRIGRLGDIDVSRKN